jgi:hypothetical protein
MKLADVSLMTGVMSQSSSGMPIVSLQILALILHTSASATHSIARTTFTAVHRCPLHIITQNLINANGSIWNISI